MPKVELRCATQRCQDDIAKWGPHYHGVYALNGEHPPAYMPTATCKCERCGGYSDGAAWKHVCKGCGKDVPAGELVGLFVPHLCVECRDAAVKRQRAEGEVCRSCNQVFSQCCC